MQDIDIVKNSQMLSELQETTIRFPSKESISANLHSYHKMLAVLHKDKLDVTDVVTW